MYEDVMKIARPGKDIHLLFGLLCARLLRKKEQKICDKGYISRDVSF